MIETKQDIKLLEYKPFKLVNITQRELDYMIYQDSCVVKNQYTKKEQDIVYWMKQVIKTRRQNNKYFGLGGINYDKLQALKGKCYKITKTEKKENINNMELEFVTFGGTNG